MKLTPLAKGFIALVIVAVVGAVLWMKFGGSAKRAAATETSSGTSHSQSIFTPPSARFAVATRDGSTGTGGPTRERCGFARRRVHPR